MDHVIYNHGRFASKGVADLVPNSEFARHQMAPFEQRPKHSLQYIAEVENESRAEIFPFPLGSIVRHKFGGIKMLIVDLNGKGHYTAAFMSPHTGLITEILFAESSLEQADVMSS